MLRAIALGANGEGRVSPNPPVGCVLARDGLVVGEGWHDRYGGLHAEAMALAAAGDKARGATAYVTLSPCHTHGRQPPCADALVGAGVTEVVAAALDPNPANARGLEILAEAGISTSRGFMEDRAKRLAAGFFKARTRGLPFIVLKYAMTLDGRIAAAGGDSRWVSCEASREVVHDMRTRADAIMVGAGTALADDPSLTARGEAYAARLAHGPHLQPWRVIVDSRCRLPVGAKALRPEADGSCRAIVATAVEPSHEKARALAGAGARVLHLPGADGKVDLDALARRLVAMGILTVLCEGGGGLAAGLVKADLVDEMAVFVAPKLIGGGDAPGPMGDLGLSRMADARRLEVVSSRGIGSDLMVTARFA